jgi:hypothetical protein
MTLADPKFISLTTIQVGKKIKDKKERVFGSASYKHYTLGVLQLTLQLETALATLVTTWFTLADRR